MAEIQANEEINGRYVLKQSKGRGTFGEVWLARDLATDEDVAIKFYVALDHKGREEFIQEFRIAAKLRHPNLLVTKDFGEWQGHPYLTMKFCDHGSAADLIGTLKPWEKDEETIWRFIHDVAAGLAYLHAVTPDPIVHQDIKPDNTLVDTDGTFLITDFGISKRVRNTMRKQSERALKAGAPAYMGPERFSSHPEPVLASDVWSLGASIYELAEGELPFCGLGGVSLLNGGEMPSLSEGWSKNLNDIMHWCLEKETWNRAKASQVEEIAEAVLKSSNSVSVASLIVKMKNGEPTEQPEPNKKGTKKSDPHATNPNVSTHRLSKEKYEEIIDHDIDEEQSPKNKKLIYGGIAALVLIVVAVAIWYFPSHNAPQPAPIVDEDTVVVADTVPVDTAKKENPVVPKPKPQPRPTPHPLNNKLSTVKKEESSHTGSLNLGYATWQGGIKGGKPDGEGTMTFSSTHRIDSRDPSRRTAEAGDNVTGTYSNGHLVDGRWHKSDGSTEYIMLGE